MLKLNESHVWMQYMFKHGSPFQKDKINDTFKTIYILIFLEISLCCETIYIEKFLALKKLFTLKDYLHWKTTFIKNLLS
jgi:hypothetical protein